MSHRRRPRPSPTSNRRRPRRVLGKPFAPHAALYGRVQVSPEPISREARHFFQCAGFLEEMCGAWNNHELNFRAHLLPRALVELDHDLVALADDEQRRGLDSWE